MTQKKINIKANFAIADVASSEQRWLLFVIMAGSLLQQFVSVGIQQLSRVLIHHYGSRPNPRRMESVTDNCTTGLGFWLLSDPTEGNLECQTSNKWDDSNFEVNNF